MVSQLKSKTPKIETYPPKSDRWGLREGGKSWGFDWLILQEAHDPAASI